MPCSPSDISITPPIASIAPPILGFGTPATLRLPNISPLIPGFPEDLIDLFSRLQFLVPPGILKPSLSANFSKDVMDAILSMFDQFAPFLYLYKFFIPVLNIILCIIEVLCSLMNPFKLIDAINKLFNQCIPSLISIFPVFAVIVMLVSLLLLILALIEYIASQVLKLVQVLLRNIIALNNAFQNGDAGGVLAIAKKIGSLLCIFQNLFVLFSIFDIVIGVIRDLLSLTFNLPPCQSSSTDNDPNSCCSPEVCATIIRSNYTRFTGTLKYYPETGLSVSNGFPAPFNQTTSSLRAENWQLFDTQQTEFQQFKEIYDADDVTVTPKPVYFPADTTYSANADIRQVPYLFDLRLFYNPRNWGRPGNARFIRFTNVIMPKTPSPDLINADNSTTIISTGVSELVGGTGFEDDGVTPLQAYGSDGVTPISGTANIENFLHMPATFFNTSFFIPPHVNDGYTFFNVEYTFKPNIAPLLQRNIVTLGCVPEVALSKGFVNNIFASDIGLKTQLLGDLINNRNGQVFPDPAAAQQCLLTAVSTLRSNLTPAGVADFQTTTGLCLSKLQNDTNSALSSIIGIGVDPCKSSFTAVPTVQFTTLPIVVTVNINEKNGLSLTTGLAADIAADIASRIKAHITFGDITNFVYDGSQVFTADLTSTVPGNGQIMISFDNNLFCTNTFSADNVTPPEHTLQSINYQFVYTPVSSASGTGETSDGKPRRDAGDIGRDGGSAKDGV